MTQTAPSASGRDSQLLHEAHDVHEDAALRKAVVRDHVDDDTPDTDAALRGWNVRYGKMPPPERWMSGLSRTPGKRV